MPPSAPYRSANQGIQQTILGIQGLSNTTATHPYYQNEMLTKIFNNLTTRSNTFAVYCTIGYFEVTNPGPYTSTNRPILGPELGTEDGTNIRHKFFAVVDRTNLTIDRTTTSSASTTNRLQGQMPVFLSYEPTTITTGTGRNGTVNSTGGTALTQLLLQADIDTTTVGQVKVRVPATGLTRSNVTGVYDGRPWTITPGTQTSPQSLVLLDIGNHQEVAYVKSIATVLGPNQPFPANIGVDIVLAPLNGTNFAYPHARGCTMQINYDQCTLGNPGPQARFNYRDPRYGGVVPFVAKYSLYNN